MLLPSSTPFHSWFSLSPFLGRSSSLPSPPLSLPAFGSFSFGLWFVRLCTFPYWLHRQLARFPFSFSLRFHSSMRCFLVSFLSSGFLPSGCRFPSPLFLFLGPSRFRASSLVSALFRWTFLWLFCLSSRLVCFAIGLLLSFLVPGS